MIQGQRRYALQVRFPAEVRSDPVRVGQILVGREGDRPRYVISVVIDYGGSGGKVSGPIANQIIHALIAEGYL